MMNDEVKRICGIIKVLALAWMEGRKPQMTCQNNSVFEHPVALMYYFTHSPASQMQICL
jgi:hypothetical protein